MNHPLTVTDRAAAHFKNTIAKEGALGFRLSIKKTGCSGYSYEMYVLNEKNEKDVCVQLANGVQLFLDVAWLPLFNELTIDFIEENQGGVKQKKLVFINPKESGRCGCGESFHLDE